MGSKKSKNKSKWVRPCWFLLLCIVALLTGCSAQDAENTDEVEWTGNPFDDEFLNDESVQYAYGFGLNIPDADTNMVYAGEPIEAEYFVENLGDEMSVGMLMFVDGIPQIYAVDGGEPTYLHILKVPACEKITVPISFTPVQGNYGENCSVRFLSILNPDLRPDKVEYVFGHTGAMTTFLPRFIEMQRSVSIQPKVYPQMDAQRNMTPEEVAQVIYVDRRGRTIDRMKSFNLIVRNPENMELPYLPVENNVLTFELQGYGGNAGSYLLIPFINHLPVQADGLPGILTVETGEKMYERSLSLDISILDAEYYGIEKYNTFYMMAIPLDGDSLLDPVQSALFVFVGE